MPNEVHTAVTRVSGRDGNVEDAEAKACVVVIEGPDLGRYYRLDRPEHVFGRSASADIQLDEESASRQHAKLALSEGRVCLYDLGSTNGTYVNGAPCGQAELRDGDLIRIGRTVFKYTSGTSVESRYYEETRRLITSDALTGAYNKRYFLEVLARELNRAIRYGRSLSLVMFDIDHFKQVNDGFGHLAGDRVLRELAALVLERIRRGDVLARYGGEEFAIILPEVDKHAAMSVCEKIRACVEEHVFEHDGRRLPVSISLGIGSLESGEADIDSIRLIAAADAKLYEAKAGGRNRVCA